MFVLPSSGAVLVLLGACATAAAQGIEVAGGITVPAPQPSAAYESTYVPLFPYVEHTGLARQTLTLDRSARAGVWGAFTWLSSSRLGVEVKAGYRQTPVGGTSSPISVAIDYLARQPPDYMQRTYHTAFTRNWPVPTGEIRQFAIDGAVLGVIGTATGTHLRAGGGLTLVRLSGHFDSLAVTYFQLGGHSVLFHDDLKAGMRMETSWAFAPLAIAELRHPFSARVSLSVCARIVLPRGTSVALAVETVESATFTTVTPADAQQALAPVPLKLRLTGMELQAGLRFAL